MKKLMKTVVASAVALVASGAFANLPSPAAPLSFDALTAGKYTVSQFGEKDDSGTTEGSRYWFAITNNSQEASAELVTVNTNDVEQGNYISIEAGAPLYRTINAVSDGYGASFSDSGATAEAIGSDGIYLDTMVKFTVSSEDTFSELDSANDKLAITCYSKDESDKTNILVRAGYVDVVGNTVTPTNYFLSLPENFDIGAWHRLTVRAIADVGYSSAPVGFAIYLDGTLRTYDTTVDPDAAPGDSTYVGSLNAAVTQNLYNSETHALLPSLIDSTSDSCGNLSAVGFKGTGSIDDIQFLGTRPEGLPTEGISVTVGWDAGVATYTVVDSNNKTLVNAASTSGVAGSTDLTLDAGVTYLTVTATYASTYTNGTWAVTGEGAQISGSTFTVVNGATLHIVSMQPKFAVGETNYGTFADALTAAVTAGTEVSPATIKLLADYDASITFVTGYIVLDLNGKTLQGGDLDEYTINNNGATLTIIDSATGGTVEAPTYAGAQGSFYTDNGLTTINAGTFESTVYTEKFQDPEATGDIVVNGGVFADPDYDPDDEEAKFYLYDYLGVDVVATYNAGYFTVGAEPPAPTTYALTLPTGVNATATVTAGGVEVANITAIEAGTEVVVTWTANAGYKITAGATENITMSANMTAATPTVAAITYATLTIDTVENCSIVVSNATVEVESGTKFDVDDSVSLTVYRTPAEGYELDGYDATENITMDQDQTVTAAVKQSGGSYPSYIPTEDAATKAKYDTWASTYSVADGASYEAAFLLNIAPDAADQTLEPTSITIENGKIVIEANKDLDAVNGKVYIKTSATLTGLDAASWSEASLDEDGAIEMTPNATGAFFKIKVGF